MTPHMDLRSIEDEFAGETQRIWRQAQLAWIPAKKKPPFVVDLPAMFDYQKVYHHYITIISLLLLVISENKSG